MIEKVISGCQNGADQAGLSAAKESGIPTGGWMPKGCITLDGPRPDLLILYNMQEHPEWGYPPRTEANVRDSDGTIRFAKNFQSPGERCTLKAIKWYNRPYLDCSMKKPLSVEEVRKWLEDNNIKVLNVAGNSEETANGIGKFVFDFLMEVFKPG